MRMRFMDKSSLEEVTLNTPCSGTHQHHPLACICMCKVNMLLSVKVTKCDLSFASDATHNTYIIMLSPLTFFIFLALNSCLRKCRTHHYGFQSCVPFKATRFTWIWPTVLWYWMFDSCIYIDFAQIFQITMTQTSCYVKVVYQLTSEAPSLSNVA